MANVKITDLVALTNPDSTDVLPIVDVGADVTKKISIADLLKNAGSGTASAPGIAFDGDNNTGIYRPGPDQVAISNNGTEKLRITSDGKLGLGTSSPSAGLHLTSAGQITSDLDTSGDLNFILADSGNAVDSGGSLVFAANNGNWRFAAIKGLVQSGAGNSRGHIAFSTRNTTADAALSEKMRITYDGKVGIGTASPSSLLHLADAGDITVGTTTGTKIGTATSQKIGFYDATPVVQPTAVADITTTATSGSLPTPDGSVTISDATTPTVTELLEYCVELEAKLEAALGHLRTLGLIAT